MGPDCGRQAGRQAGKQAVGRLALIISKLKKRRKEKRSILSYPRAGRKHKLKPTTTSPQSRQAARHPLSLRPAGSRSLKLA
jgi:hypothetical protein